MDCQCCQRNPAQVRVCDVEMNEVQEQYNVCSDCWTLLKRLMFDPGRALVPTSEAIASVRELIQSKQTALAPMEPKEIEEAKDEAAGLACPECGMTLAEFKLKGRFGCPRDYEVFAEHLEPLFERIHDVIPPRHTGRRPASVEEGIPSVPETSLLKRELEDAVEREDFERAAELRDKILKLEGEAAKGETA